MLSELEFLRRQSDVIDARINRVTPEFIASKIK